jgi:hypothetical protein
MKLYQLLKLRKKVIKEITELQQKVMHSNSIIVGGDQDFDVIKLMEQTIAKKMELVKLKHIIQKNTLPVYDKIFMIEEYKDYIKTLKSTSTLNGTVEKSRFGDSSVIEHKATIKAKDMDLLIKSYEEKIEKLQEELDGFNYTTEVDY